MASADLLVLLERRRSWRKYAATAVCAVATLATVASLTLPQARVLAFALLGELMGFETETARHEPVARAAPAPAAQTATASAPGMDEGAAKHQNAKVDGATGQVAGAAGQVAGVDDDSVVHGAGRDSRGNAEIAIGTVPAAPELRPRKLVDWLGDIARSADRGLILAPDVGGEATAMFDESTRWEDRLDALARVHGFHYTVGERLIEAWTGARDAAPQPAIEQSPSSRPGVEEKPAEPLRSSRVMRPFHARAADLVSALSKPARASKVEITSDPNSNSVVIAGPEEAVAALEHLVWALDVPRRRFILEAEIVELSRTARQELGVRWTVDGTVGALVDFPAADAPGEGASIIVATDGAHALRARISALAADGHVRVVSRPRVVVLEGRPASIESVRILRVRFPSSSVVGNVDDGAVAPSRAFEEIPVGVMLRVEPSMQTDGRIVLRIRAKSSNLGPPQPPDDIPEELSRMVDAEVAVADGETAVLGGLLREGFNHSATGVPGLRSVPAVGLLFGKRQHLDEGEELVVLVTPRLIS